MTQAQDRRSGAAGTLGAWLLTLWATVAPAQEALFGNIGAHDPSTMIRAGSRYYVFSTGQGIPIKYSTDLRNWTSGGQVFPSGPPAWSTNAVAGFTGFFWAPDIAYFNGQYHLYYSCSSWGTIDSAIGLVTTPSLISPSWADQGKVVQSDAVWEAGPDTDTTSINCIDPSVLVDTNGSVWLSYGSYADGIMVTPIDPATGKRLNPASPGTKVASSSTTFFNNTTEASFLFQRGGSYYLFINYGGCCSGVDSTYNIRVGRSTSPTGPYLDRNGNNMLGGGGTVILESSGRFIGPGHAGILVDNGTNWFTFHYYDGNDNGNAKLGLMRLDWTDDGWPVLSGDWSAFYTFDVDGREHRAWYNGTLQGGAGITNEPGRGNVLNLAGTSQHVSLPISVANARTFAGWVKWNGGADWQRIFDFGDGSNRYLFLTPRAFNGRMRFAISVSGIGGEQVIDAPAALLTGAWQHVAVTLDGARGVMYLNGNPVATNNALTIRPWQVLARSNYFGRSQFAADPYFNGRLDSVRIFGRALSAPEIQELVRAHPALAHRYSFTSNAWDSIGLAHGRLMGNATVTNQALKLTGASGGYVNLPGGLVSGSSAVSAEFWASFGTNGNWARVFDFGSISGSSGANYLFFSPHNSTGGTRLEISTSSGTRTFDTAGAFDDKTLQVVCIVDPANNYAAIYTNGLLRVAYTNSLPALSGVSSAWSFLGRSLWSADAWLNATIDELRIYDGRLTPAVIAASYNIGPDNLTNGVPPPAPASLTAVAGDQQVSLSWSPTTDTAGYNLKRALVSAGPYTTIAAGLSDTNYTDTGLANGTTYYYVVTATNSIGESADSPQTSATPLSAFQAWQMQYFDCWACPSAAPGFDADGDGMSNTNEFLAGTDPTNSASAFRIVLIMPVGNDMVVTWQGGAGKTAAVQAVSGDYSTNFADIGGGIVIPPGGTTNYPDTGAATNSVGRFYRVRLVP